MTSSLLTLLIDLDDTLLVNPVKEFMEKYLKLLSEYMEPYVDPKVMVPQLLKSTDLMIDKVHPYQTLESVFDADFYPALGLDITEIKPIVNRFYTDVFPEIQSQTSPRPEAIEAIQHAFSLGYHVVIATNPLFPKLATSLRLAGLAYQILNTLMTW
jgi:phosphoglycolate phosphatase-like HAD superfamily hydrolase